MAGRAVGERRVHRPFRCPRAESARLPVRASVSTAAPVLDGTCGTRGTRGTCYRQGGCMGFVHQFWQLTIDGLMSGSLYAVIALGYTLVYGVLQLINFAHSEVFMLGAFGGLFAARGLVNGFDSTPSGMTSVAIVLVGLAVGALCGAAAAFTLERVAYRPLRKRNAPRLAYLISAIGA